MFYMIKRNICSFNKSIKKINITASWVFVCKDSIKSIDWNINSSNHFMWKEIDWKAYTQSFLLGIVMLLYLQWLIAWANLPGWFLQWIKAEDPITAVFFFSYNNKKKGGKWEWKYLVFVFVLMPNILPGYKKTLAWHQLHAVFREYREHQYPELVKGASACISYKTLASCILLFLARRLMNLLTKWHFAFDSLVDSWSWRRWMAWQIHRIASRWCDCKRCISSQLPASTAFIESSSLFSGGPGLFFLLEILFVRI
jgi:hypothetical protein